jgi:hypothetical protein
MTTRTNALLLVSCVVGVVAGMTGVAGVLSLSVGPLLIFNARTWFGIDTRYNPIFMAMPFLQGACFLPFGLLVRKKDKATLASAHRPTGR